MLGKYVIWHQIDIKFEVWYFFRPCVHPTIQTFGNSYFVYLQQLLLRQLQGIIKVQNKFVGGLLENGQVSHQDWTGSVEPVAKPREQRDRNYDVKGQF